jgi:hypothetical protein
VPYRKIKRNCNCCGKEYRACTGRLRSGTGLYCSCKCANTVNQVGSGNGNWKGGISSDNYKYAKRYRQKNPKAYLAHAAVRRAKASGKLIPQPCVVCGSTEKLECHHEGYDKPLVVVWMCGKHHRMLPRKTVDECRDI